MSLRSLGKLVMSMSVHIGGDAGACCRRFCGAQPARAFGQHMTSGGGTLLGRVAGPAIGSGLLRRITTKFGSTETDKKIPLTKVQADELVLKLTVEEHEILMNAIQRFQSEKTRQEYKGQLAGWSWRSKLGRPSSLHKLGDADVTGSYCPLPEDWLNKKFAETQPVPTSRELAHLGLHNALPFIGFGFLDNFIMIVAGDYIDLTIGMTLGISTMAAAALGNTISDIAGIGSAWYVENIVTKVGFKPPALSPIQLEMGSSRRVANFGRAIGVALGCLLGMLPLMFLPTKNKRHIEKPIQDVPSAEEELL